MITSRNIGTNHLSYTISENQAAIIPEHCVTNSRFDTNARCTSCDNQILDSMPLKSGIQLGVIETTVSALVNDHVVKRQTELVSTNASVRRRTGIVSGRSAIGTVGRRRIRGRPVMAPQSVLLRADGNSSGGTKAPCASIANWHAQSVALRRYELQKQR